MIQLFNSQSRKVDSFKTFEELMEYFNREENLKPYEPNNPHEHGKWNFVYYPHRRLAALYNYMRNKFTEREQEAYEAELDLVELYTGDHQYPEQYVVNSELDLNALIKD